jgi:competence protein ComEC
MLKRTLAAFLLVFSCVWGQSHQLTFYFLDMSGGASTLIVTPSGESVLIDTGSLQPPDRDDERIFQACQDAGLRQIDHLITTHFHSDHFGALAAVTKKIPVKNFYDKGSLPSLQEQNSAWFRELYPLYVSATNGAAKILRAGDCVPLCDRPITLRCMAAEKRVWGFSGNVDEPGQGFIPAEIDSTDNGRSIALLLTWGSFSCWMGGDITKNVEHHLVSPRNRLGQVDLYQVTHHGWDLSNNIELLQAVQPILAVAMNGPHKGIQPQTFKSLTAQPSLQALYQMHYNDQYGEDGNAPLERIANARGQEQGRYVRVAVDLKTKTMTVSMGSAGERKEFLFH